MKHKLLASALRAAVDSTYLPDSATMLVLIIGVRIFPSLKYQAFPHKVAKVKP